MMARNPKASVSHSLLSRIPKRGREAIDRIMEERDGTMALAQFLAKRWDFEEFLSADGLSNKAVAQRVANLYSQMASEHPGWSQEKIRAAISVSYLSMNLKEVAIARRFTLDDPGELARGLSTLSRVRWLDGLIGSYSHVDFDVVLEAFAACDLPAAMRLVEGEIEISQGESGFFGLHTPAVVALCRKDFAKALSLTRKMAKQKLRPWQQGVCTCLTAMADHQPKQVADGLALLLKGMHDMRQKDELAEAINLPAQGLYRLGEWISPELVAEFDVTQGFPWDAGFHAWCQTHPDPLAGVDLTRISPSLHDAVVLLRPPAAWTTSSAK